MHPRTGASSTTRSQACAIVPAALQELDEVWRTHFNDGLIRPAARRQPGGVRVADVSAAEYEDEDAYFSAAYNSGNQTFALEDLRSQTQCWNCRGFGHARPVCSSSVGYRAINLCIQVLQSASDSSGRGKGKGTGKGKGKGRGGGGRGRAAAGRGSGAIAAYVEDDHAYALDGTLLVVYRTPAPEADEHDDEEAHTALTFNAAASSSSGSFDDGDGWMDQLESSTRISVVNIAAIESTSESGDYSSEESEGSEESTYVCVAQLNPLEESPDESVGADFGIVVTHAPAAANVANFCTAPAAHTSWRARVAPQP